MNPGQESERPKLGAGGTASGQTKIFTTCPGCLQGLSRYREDAPVEADYIVVELARHILCAN